MSQDTNNMGINKNNDQTDKENNTNNHSDSNNTHDEKQSGIHSSHRIETKKKIIFGAVFFISIIIIVGVMAANMLVTRTIESKVATADSAVADSAYQSSLLSNGLAIIAIAISVWAGLNIANAIERRELDKFDDKLKNSEDRLEDRLKESEEKLKKSEDRLEDRLKESEEKLKKVDEIEPIVKRNEKIQNTLFNMFQNELLKTANDEATYWLYNQIIDPNKVNIKDIDSILSDLVVVEELFFQVYTTHTSVQKNDENTRNLSDQAKAKITELLEKKSLPETIKTYLKYREAEFEFYCGYATNDSKIKYSSFNNAADIYLNLAVDFDVTIPKYDEEKNDTIIVPKYSGKLENKTLSMYFLNSIGESYSRILLNLSSKSEFYIKGTRFSKDDFIKIGKKGEFYLQVCVNWQDSFSKREVYYRNLGCLLERLDIIEDNQFGHFKEIVDCYKKAFCAIVDEDNTMYYRAGSVYHVLIQYLFKYVNFKLRLTEKDSFERFNKGIKISKKDIEEACIYIKELFVLFQFAQTEIPRKRLHYSVEGLLYTIVISCKQHGISEIEKACNYNLEICIENVKHVYEALAFTNPPETDKYYKELKKRLGILNIINEGDNEKENV